MRFLYIFLSFFLLSCSQRVLLEEEEQTFALSSLSPVFKNNYMTCNVFSDETFHGYIHSSSEKNCISVEFENSPKDLFENTKYFLQIYPFKAVRKEMIYGEALRIHILDKESDQLLLKSLLLDIHVIKVELNKDKTDSFLQDHRFEICNIDKAWDGIQFVIYEKRRLVGSKNVPVRITRVLKPPFLIYPEYFRDKKGDVLANHHPFFEYISIFDDPNNFYELAEKTCN
ncbi:MAG: hypothetical protein GDA46_02850 [Bdellovibrionales bacterium]|nr:hypothetical protein [Bdellovibrionales bacterium]